MDVLVFEGISVIILFILNPQMTRTSKIINIKRFEYY